MGVLKGFSDVRSELPMPGSQAAETTQLRHPCSGHLTAAVVSPSTLHRCCHPRKILGVIPCVTYCRVFISGNLPTLDAIVPGHDLPGGLYQQDHPNRVQ